MRCKLKRSTRCKHRVPSTSQLQDAMAICGTFGRALEQQADADVIPTDYCPFTMVAGNVALDAVVIIPQGGEVDGVIRGLPFDEQED